MARVTGRRAHLKFAARMRNSLQSTARRFGSGARRLPFEELTAGADASQVEFMKECIIQVDARDQVLGPISKKDAHLHDGVLHRAFSAFVFNANNELLVQKRAAEKITFPGMWANTCCSHPLFSKEEMEDGDGVKRAAIRKLEHELGIPETSFRVADMRYLTTILYKAASDANWTEYEMDHILLARGDVDLAVNENEVEAIEFIGKDELEAFLADESRAITPWFRLIAQNLLPKWWENLELLLAAPTDPERTIHDYR